MPNEFEKLCRLRSSNCTKLSNLIVKCQPKDLNLQQLKMYKKKVDDYFEEASHTLSAMSQIAKDDELDQIQIDFEAVEKKYEDLQVELQTRLDTASATNPCKEVKLPKLTLPDFTGKPEDWLAYRDLFMATVHNNNNLTGAQKLQYLKSSLKGDAARIIQSSVINDTGYQPAWDRVVKRFDNKREIVQAVIAKLMTQPSVTAESPTALRTLVDTTTECVSSLVVLERPVTSWDDILIYAVVQKLDHDSRRQWELSLTSSDHPSFQSLVDFLEQRARALSSIEPTKGKVSSNSKSNYNLRSTTSSHVSNPSNPCVLCNEEHFLFRCTKFLALSVDAKVKALQSHGLCYNCLRKGHMTSSCPNPRRCQRCQKKHHTSIHADEKRRETTTDSTPVPTLTCKNMTTEHILLQTAIVKIKDAHGGQHLCRVMLDNGSQRSLVTESFVQRLNLPRSKVNVGIAGVGGNINASSRGSVHLLVSSIPNPNFNISVETLVIPKITGDTPTCPTPVNSWPHILNLNLADPNFSELGPIDVLFGANILNEIYIDGRRKGLPGTPTAYNSMFGWVLLGPASESTSLALTTSLVIQDSLDVKLEKFWKMEEIPSASHLTPEESQCEQHFTETHRREPSGRYVVQLPFKTGHPALGYSRARALSRFQQQEARLQRNPEHKALYVNFMREYEALGHMLEIPPEDIPCNEGSFFYLPHHAVFKWSSSTTKCRIVFDASCKSSTGMSLNDILMNGPIIQDSLFTHLLRFRLHAIPFVGDIEKMYRMIGVAKEHWNFQRILWREDPSLPLKDYWLTVLTFGTKSAPFLAIRSLRQCAIDESRNFPLAFPIVHRDFYVDNLMSGCSSLPEAVEAARQLPLMLARGNFNLREWFSCDTNLLKSIPENLRGTQKIIAFENEDSVGALGLKWHLAFDSFKYQVNTLKEHKLITKRSIVSDVASLYDPLGWLSPITVVPKDLIRKMWQRKLQWDEEVPAQIKESWIEFRRTLNAIQGFYIPRRITRSDSKSYQLCGFSDASELAYSAAVYLRVVTNEDVVHVELVTAKVKIAPVSQRSIPRLELCGSLLLSKLMKTVHSTLDIVLEECHAWTDSQVVLAWIGSYPRRWSTFVANRVAAIQDCGIPLKWHHVTSALNPADCASRGVSVQGLSSHPLWWNGPSFLRDPLPRVDTDVTFIPERALEEEKVSAKVTLVNTSTTIFHRFSSFQSMCRVLAYCLRFIHNSRAVVLMKKGLEPTVTRKNGFLSAVETRSSLHICIKICQHQQFPDEIRCLLKAKPLHHTSKLISLSPFVDPSGILRVGGRIQKAEIPEHRKHPILLPRSHHLTSLIVKEEHCRLLHAGPQAVLASLSSRYWILNGRDSVRGVVGRCLVCVRIKGQVAKQMMGNLPRARVNPAPAFTQCGVDYAGPFTLKVVKGRGHQHFKGYLALFISFTTRAVHLELVSELTSAAFISALTRFSSRRGKPQVIHSDNGSNFIGANRELREFFHSVRAIATSESVARHVANEGITWVFIPPGAPHFGGLWEAGVKSVKYHLKRVIGDVILDFEQMYTVLTKIEACLNSRPLCPMSSDPADLTVLTPAHFLIGEPITGIPEEDLHDVPMNRLSKWQMTQRISQHFWRRWSSEYLSRLQQRPKWWAAQPNLKTGDLVLIKEEQKTPLQWRMARVEEVHPGEDGLVRVVTVRTSDGLFKRSINKLCPLPIDNPNDNESVGNEEDKSE